MESPGSCRRAVLKLSGGAFAPRGGKGFDEEQVGFVTRELVEAQRACPELAVVLGGGNIMRGAQCFPTGPSRVRADHAGMAATVVNALVLQDSLLRSDVPCTVYSALPIGGVAAAFSVEQCALDLEDGCIVLLAGGTGNPLFTTDTAAALRAVQLGAEILLKATRVDGVYSADPERHPDAELYERLSYEDVIKGTLGVMDLCAVSLCMEHGVPVRVFNYGVEGNIRRALSGEPVGTLIGRHDDVG
jgi:uridylate kinase